MRYGIVDYLLRVRQESTFYLAAQLGFDCLELAVSRIGDADRLPFDSTRSVSDFEQSSGVRVESFYATHFLHESLSDPGEEHQKAALQSLRRIVGLAQQNSVQTVVVPMVGASSIDTQVGRLTLESVLDRAVSWEESNGVRLAIKAPLAAEEQLAIVSRHQEEKVGVCFDPSNCVPLYRDPGAEIETLGKRLIHVHLKDRTTRGASVPLGSGDLDVDAVFSSLRRQKYDGLVVLDTAEGSTALDAARANLDLCRNMAA